MSKKENTKQTPTAEQFIAKQMLNEQLIEGAKKELANSKDEQCHFARLCGFIERRVRNTTKEGDEIALVPSYILKAAIRKAAEAARAYKKAKTDKARKYAEQKALYQLAWAILTREAIVATVNFDPFTNNRNVKEKAYGLQEVKDGKSNIPDELRRQIIWSGKKGKAIAQA